MPPLTRLLTYLFPPLTFDDEFRNSLRTRCVGHPAPSRESEDLVLTHTMKPFSIDNNALEGVLPRCGERNDSAIWRETRPNITAD